jgi:hypothetical protein
MIKFVLKYLKIIYIYIYIQYSPKISTYGKNTIKTFKWETSFQMSINMV